MYYFLLGIAGVVSGDTVPQQIGHTHEEYDANDQLHLLQTKANVHSSDPLHVNQHHIGDSRLQEASDAVQIIDVSNMEEISDRAKLPLIAVKPLNNHPEGLGRMLQNYRKSLSYALGLDVPWVGSLVNTHDNVDYTRYLGLCQPLCDADLDSFDKMHVDAFVIDLDSGSFKIPKGLTRPTLLLVSEIASLEFDEGHTHRIAGIRKRFLAQNRGSHQCPSKPFLTYHLRWGDLATSDYDHPDHDALGMSTAVGLINKALRVCDFDVKVMSEGEDVGKAFAKRFSGSFQYINGYQSDGYQSSVEKDLLLLSCSTVLVGGTSSFTVLGALLSQSVVLAPKKSIRYQGLDFVLDSANTSFTALHHALKKSEARMCKSTV